MRSWGRFIECLQFPSSFSNAILQNVHKIGWKHVLKYRNFWYKNHLISQLFKNLTCPCPFLYLAGLLNSDFQIKKDSSSIAEKAVHPLISQLHNLCDCSYTNFLISNQWGHISALIRRSKCTAVVSTPGFYWKLQQALCPDFVLLFWVISQFQWGGEHMNNEIPS